MFLTRKLSFSQTGAPCLRENPQFQQFWLNGQIAFLGCSSNFQYSQTTFHIKGPFSINQFDKCTLIVICILIHDN